jgi:sugar (pentulose or hexulose) kinase
LVPESSESVLLGNLLLALSALGDTENLAETADSIVKIGDAFTPRSEYRAMYDDMFALYRESYRGLKEVFGRLAGMKDQGGI